MSITERLQGAASAVFEREVAIYPVATGTAANALALAQLAPPLRGHLLPRRRAHRHGRMRSARIFHRRRASFSACLRPTEKSGRRPLAAAMASRTRWGCITCSPSAVSVTQATELGTVYSLDELAALTAAAQTARAAGAHGRRALRERAGASGLFAGRGHLEERHRRALVRRLQERGSVRRGGRVFQSVAGARISSGAASRPGTCGRNCAT